MIRKVNESHAIKWQSLKAVHCFSGRKKVFPQTFLSELSWVISKSKDLSFCKYVKIIFLELKTFIAGKRINLSAARRSSLLKDHQTQQKNVMIPTSSDPSMVRNARYF